MISDEYAAGFFDGEGSVYLATRSTTRPSPTLLVCIGNTNREVLDLHRDRWGGSIRERGGKHRARVLTGRWQRQYQWVLSTRMAKAFLTAIVPHVLIKKDVTIAALRYITLMEVPRRERVDYSQCVRRRGRLWVAPVVRPEFEAQVAALHTEIRGLNARSAPGNVLRGT